MTTRTGPILTSGTPSRDFRDVSLGDEFKDEGSEIADWARDHDGSVELANSTNHKWRYLKYNVAIVALLVIGALFGILAVELELHPSLVSSSSGTKKIEEPDKCIATVTLKPPKQFDESNDACCGIYASQMTVSHNGELCPAADGSDTNWCDISGTKSSSTYAKADSSPEFESQIAKLSVDVDTDSTHEITVEEVYLNQDLWFSTVEIELLAPNATKTQLGSFTGEILFNYYDYYTNEYQYQSESYTPNYVVDLKCGPGCKCTAFYRTQQTDNR